MPAQRKHNEESKKVVYDRSSLKEGKVSVLIAANDSNVSKMKAPFPSATVEGNGAFIFK